MKAEQLKDILSAPWLDKLAPFIESKEFDRIVSKIQQDRRHHTVVPRTDRIFTALNKCPPDKIKVVMGLQDPYNTVEPDGLAMSCSLTTGAVQPSLREVQREIKRTVPADCRYQPEAQMPRDLSYWAEQGVFLINASLTVRWGEPNSHQGLWDKFIDEVFHEGVNKAEHPIVYIMLGKEAQKFSKYARLGDYLLNASHPASVAYSGGVWDCQDVFQRANTYLILHEMEPIKW